MKPAVWVVAALAWATLTPRPALAQRAGSQGDLAAGVRLFEQADCQAAVTRLERAVASGLPVPDRIRARDILWLCYQALGEETRAADTIRALLQDDPTYQPGSGLKAGVRLPPDARELFEQIRARVGREAEVANATTTSARSRRLAYIVLQRVANESSAGKSFTNQIQALQQTQAAALKERNDRLTGIRAKLAAASGPTWDALKKEESLVSQEVERFTADAQGDLQALQTKLRNTFEAQITPVLGALATAWKLDVILNSVESGLVWADPGLDVTAAVIDRLEGRPTQSPPPADFRGAAFVQLQRIANESLEGKAATGQIQALQQKKSTELTMQNQQLRSLQLKLEKDGAALSASAQADLQKQLERLQVDIQRLTEDAQSEISALQERLQQQFQTRIQPILAQTGQEKRLHLIFSGADSGLVWADSALDLSTEIIKKLDASTKPLVK